MKSLSEFYERVSSWNAARYDRVFNHDLAVQLLKEELAELYEAESKVDELDALCDICFVAFGVVWKANIEQEEKVNLYSANIANNIVQDLVNVNNVKARYLLSAYIATFEFENDYPVEQNMHVIASLCVAEMFYMGLDFDTILEALKAVCDSNDTKEIKGKTPSHVKANISKGAGYISPTDKLTKIVEGAKWNKS